jgi:hypothetical protein
MVQKSFFVGKFFAFSFWPQKEFSPKTPLRSFCVLCAFCGSLFLSPRIFVFFCAHAFGLASSFVVKNFVFWLAAMPRWGFRGFSIPFHQGQPVQVRHVFHADNDLRACNFKIHLHGGGLTRLLRDHGK